MLELSDLTSDQQRVAMARAAGPPAMPGAVHLVGVGPGDPGAVTVRAARLLATADVVAHDKLVPREVLALAHPDAQLVDVGRRANGPYVGRAAVDQLLREAALDGRSVVRLKGGDPFVFGRGAEEAQALAEAGIPVEVVPGVTSAVAVPAAAGIPVTLRAIAPGVAVVTGHETPSKADEQLDVDALAGFGGTVVVLMGVSGLPRMTARLMAAGRAPDTPVAIVAHGGWTDQVLVEGTLATIVEEAARAAVPTPAVVVVGEVVAHRIPTIDRAARPLHGVRVAVPRLSTGPSRIAVALAHAGADVTQPHVLRAAPPPAGPLDAVAAAVVDGALDAVLVTSTASFDVLLRALVAAGGDVRSLAGTALWVSGRRTAAVLADRGVVADLVVDGPAALCAAPPRGAASVAVLAADGVDGGMADALRAVGSEVVVVASSVTIATDEPIGAPDSVVVVAASRLAPSVVGHAGPVVAVGPTTAAALAGLGIDVAVVADDPAPDGVAAAVRVAVHRNAGVLPGTVTA